MLSCEEQSWLQLGGGIVPIPGKKAEFTGQHQHVRKQPGRAELLRLFEGLGVGVLRLVQAVGISQCHAKKEVWEPVSGLIVPRIEGEGDSTLRQQERFPVATLGLHGDRQCRQTPDGHRRASGPLGNCECSPGCGLSAKKVASEDTTVARVGMQKGLVLEWQTGRFEGGFGTFHHCDRSILEGERGYQREAKRDVDLVGCGRASTDSAMAAASATCPAFCSASASSALTRSASL